MEIYKEMKDILSQNNIDVSNLGEEYYNDRVFDLLSDQSISNAKGESWYGRFRDVVSDPNNLFIHRCEDSGKVKDGVVTLHNGIKIYDQCYYNDFSDIFSINLGVHEPSEERMFAKVLKYMDKGSVMIELGSYWAFYSMWFARDVEDSICYCIEPELENLNVGIRNFELNNLNGNFYQGYIGHGNMNVYDFAMTNGIEKIDLLHSDIQGSELQMLEQITPLLDKKLVKYIFIATHDNSLHNSCMDYLKSHGYRIICDCDFDKQTFQCDGFILACPEDVNEIEKTNIGDRSKAKLISETYFSEFFNNRGR